MSGAAGAVQNQNRVADPALRVARGLSERCVVEAQVRQRFARAKLEILHDKVAFGRGRLSLLPSGGPLPEEDHGKQAKEKS